MKLKKVPLTTFIIIVTIVIFTYIDYLGVISYNNGYEKISDDTKEKITSIINKSKGEIPNLQTDNCKASWIDEAHNKQKEMMDKILDTLNVVGEARKGKPNKYITATFYDNMQVFIAYNEKEPYKDVVLEVDGHYYVATTNEGDVSTIVEYMKKNDMLK